MQHQFPESPARNGEERFRAEQFSSLARHTPAAMLATVCNALVFVTAAWATPDFPAVVVWAATVSVIAAIIFLRRIRRRPLRAGGASRTGVRHAVGFALLLGLLWAALPLLFFNSATHAGKLLIACLCSGMLGGGVLVLASVPAAATAFAAPIAFGCLAALIRTGDAELSFIAAVLGVYAAILLKGVHGHAEAQKALLLAQIEAERRAGARLRNLHSSGLAALGGMTTGIAHEIGQPLTAAATYVASARRIIEKSGAVSDVDAARALAAAETQLASARAIIGHMRDTLSRNDPEKSFLHLHDAICEACDSHRAALDGAGIELSLDLAARDDLILGAGVQIRQVVGNLIRNAMEALESSSERRLKVASSSSDADTIRVDVIDAGPGVSPAIAADLFETFTTTKPEGMGVGLAISRSIIEAHHGAIWAEPNPRGGAVFSFTLPRAHGVTCA